MVSSKALQILGVETEQPRARPVSVNGQRLDVSASAVVSVQLQGLPPVQHRVTAVDGIRPEFVMGMDLIGRLARRFSIDLSGSSICINGVSIPFKTEETSTTMRRLVPAAAVVARVSETVTIPARSLAVIKLRVASEGEQGLFEPAQKFIDRTGILPSRILTISSDDGTIAVRVCNPGTDSVVLYDNQTAGTFDAAELADDDDDDNEQAMSDSADFNISEELESEQRRLLQELLRKHESAFSTHEFDLGTTQLLQHEIHLEDGSRPVRQKQRNIPLGIRRQVDKKISEMRRHGIIEPSTSPWASNLIVVRKRNNEIRLCTDWRSLNAFTVKDAYPLPSISQALNSLAGSSWFSTLDLRQGFHQVEVRPEDREKTAFYSTQGLMQFRKLGFGMCNAPATFQRLMELILGGLSWTEALTYLDDVIVFNSSFEQHMSSLTEVLQRLQQAGLKLNKAKSYFCYRRVNYLGHIISKDGISPSDEKIRAIQNLQRPVCSDDVRRLVGLLSFYRRFVPRFADVARPLHNVAQKGKQFTWTEECEKAFDRLKETLAAAPVLRLPDFNCGFQLSCDSSAVAIAGVLSQRHEGIECPIAFASRVLTKAERNYSTTHRELLAIVWSVRHFRPYLASASDIQIFTDHKPLKGLLNSKDPEGRLARWLSTLQELKFTLHYRPGKENVVPDVLSRAAATRVEPLWTTSELRTWQSEDPVLAATCSLLNGEEHRSFGRLARRVRALTDSKVELSDHGVLIHGNVPVLPPLQQRELLRLAHDNPCSGHLGAERTLERVSNRGWWLNMAEDVSNWVGSCVVCQSRKQPREHQRAPLQSNRIPREPWEVLQVDIKGPLPMTEAGNRYIICFIDVLTKWVEAVPSTNIEAATVAQMFLSNVVLRHGTPQIVHSDQGRQFESQLFSELCRLLGLEKTRTTPFHPSGNPVVERFNRTLGDMLASYCMDCQRDWDQYLAYVIWAYNSSVHCSTKMSPFRALRGYSPRQPLELVLPSACSSENLPDSLQHVRRGFELLHQRLTKAQRARNRYYNRRTNYQPFRSGELVMIDIKAIKPGQSKSLRRRWTGPYRVLRRLGPVTYAISKVIRGKPSVVHHDRLKRFVKRRGGDGEVSALPRRARGERSTERVEDARDTWRQMFDEDDVRLRRSRRIRKRPDFYVP